MILYSLFIRSCRFWHKNDTYLIRPLPNAEAEQMFLERVVLKWLFDFWRYLSHFSNPFIFRAPYCAKKGLFRAPLIFARFVGAKIKGARKLKGLRYSIVYVTSKVSEMLLKGDVRSNFYHIFFLSNLKVFFLTITKIYILSIFVFLLPKYSALKFFYCCHGCNICDVKIALFSKLRLRKKIFSEGVCLIVRVRIFHLIL